MKKTLLILMIGLYPSFSFAVTLPSSVFFTKYAHPAGKGMTACGGNQLTFTTPAVGNIVGVTFRFFDGSSVGNTCSGATVGNGITYNGVCVDGVQAQGNTLYCVDSTGLSELSAFATAGSTATCFQMRDLANTNTVAIPISCTSVGSCSYTGASSGAITLVTIGSC